MTDTIKVGGHLLDPDDPRFWDYKVLAGTLAGASSGSVDLRPYSSTAHNQMATASCVANAVAKALEIKERFHQASQGLPMAHTDISRLHLYYLSRELHRAQNRDGGTYISLCCEALNRFGLLPESVWPFDLRMLCVSPSWGAMRKAYPKKIGLSGYYRIKSTGDDRVADAIQALRAGHPVVYGTIVDSAHWFKYRAGDVLRPLTAFDGRHATVLVGWDDAQCLFIGENSWGRNWGDKACYLMDPAVVSSPESRDFWVIRGHWEAAPRP